MSTRVQVFRIHFHICEEGKCLDQKLLFLPLLLEMAQRARAAWE